MDNSKIRLKIISDGTPIGTHIVREDTGEELDNVRSVQWGINVHGLAFAYFEVIGVAIEAVSIENRFGSDK